MKVRLAASVLAWSTWGVMVQAADSPSLTRAPVPATTNTTTIMASAVLSPGRYTSSVSPNINGEMASRITKSLGAIPGLDKATTDPADSSIHFTVKPDAHVSVSTIQQAVAKSDHGGVVSEPILEHSETVHLGL